MKLLIFVLLFLPLTLFSQTTSQGQVDSSDDNPPGLEEAWKYKYSSRGGYQSPYGSLEREIPESYGNSPKNVSTSGKGHATKCRPKKYRKTFELPPEAFSDYCKAMMGKKNYANYKKKEFIKNGKSKKAYHNSLLQKYFKTGHGNRKGSREDANKFIITSTEDLKAALKAHQKGKVIHDHRNGKKGCPKCQNKKSRHHAHSKYKKYKKRGKKSKSTLGKSNIKYYNPFNLTTLKTSDTSKIFGVSQLPMKKRSKKVGRSLRGKSTSSGRGRSPSSSGKIFKTISKPDLGYSQSHSRGSSVLINYKPSKKNKGKSNYEWGTRNK
ncbi:MAG: hypothetical protein KC493_09065 [Bacteriovoracaceae bacterium]|nr:hypothetical protein [Bacteriovoracaceae bacterium]